MNPFRITEPTCISFSGGRTSAYMLYKVLEAHDMSLPEDAIVCFANTGKEAEATLKFVHDCEINWGIKIHWLEYDQKSFVEVSYETASRNGEPFEKLIEYKKYLPNAVTRFCTEELKVKVINKFLESKGIEADTMVGIRADEPRRLPKLRSRGLNVALANANINKNDVLSFWKSQPFDLGLEYREGVTPLGNCDLCFLKGPKQLIGLIKDKPERAIWWAKQEEKIGATFIKNSGGYKSIMEFMNNQGDMFDSEGSISCFCGD